MRRRREQREIFDVAFVREIYGVRVTQRPGDARNRFDRYRGIDTTTDGHTTRQDNALRTIERWRTVANSGRWG